MRKCISVNFVFFVIAHGFKRNEIAIMIYRNGLESEHMLLFFFRSTGFSRQSDRSSQTVLTTNERTSYLFLEIKL